jgi:hypothetical protein
MFEEFRQTQTEQRELLTTILKHLQLTHPTQPPNLSPTANPSLQITMQILLRLQIDSLLSLLIRLITCLRRTSSVTPRVSLELIPEQWCVHLAGNRDQQDCFGVSQHHGDTHEHFGKNITMKASNMLRIGFQNIRGFKS